MFDESAPTGPDFPNGRGAERPPTNPSAQHPSGNPGAPPTAPPAPHHSSIEQQQMERHEKRKDRRNNVLIAMVGAMVTVAVALGTSALASRQAHEDLRISQQAEDARADEDFRRAEQRDAYSAFFAAAADLRAAHLRVANAIRCACLNLPNADWKEYDEAWDAFEQGKTELSRSYANLYLVASVDTQQAADKVSSFLDRIAEKEMIAADNEMRDEDGGDGSKREKYYAKLEQVSDLQQSFLKSAKNDIAVYGN
jgi:hypothetical protein